MSVKGALRGLAFAISLLLPTTAVWAQLSLTATISGTVTDTTGADVPGAKVTITNEGTGISTETESNTDGTFVAPGLAVGTYKVTVAKEGFQTYVEEHIALHPTVVTTVTAVMKVGQVSTEVTVSASAVQVQTSTPEVSNSVSGNQVQTLPLNGRNYQSLSALMPGVTNTSPDTALNQGGFLTSNVMSINGQGTSGTMYYLDGIWNMNTGNMTQTTVTPNPDTVDEVRVLQNNYGVQYSLMGANVVLLQTKSGTSQFHGTAYEYFRNTSLNARNFFAPTVPTLQQNIFGYTIGGPIYIPHHYNTDKSKTFFFWSQQWSKQHVASVVLGADPTAAMRSGDFGAKCTTGFTATGICTTPSEQIKNPVTGQPFLNNIITTPLNPNSLALLNTLATLPNNPSGGFNNFINLTPTINSTRDDEIRVDHNFNQKIRLMAEYLDERQTNGNSYDTFLGSPYTTNSNPVTTQNQLAQVHLTATLSSTMVNSTSVAMNNYVVSLAAAGTYQRSQVQGYSSVLPFEGGFGSNRLPQINFSGGWAPLGWVYNLPLNHASDLENTLTDDWSWLRGNHFIQAGMQIVFGTKRQTAFSASNGQWMFNGQFTGDPIADYLLGDAQNFTQTSTETRPYVHYPIDSPYVQDRWKATKRLTLTAGLRLEYLPATHAQQGYISIFDPSKYNPGQAPIVNNDGSVTPTPNYNPQNGLIFNGEGGYPLNFSNAHAWDWAPSVGFAWDVFGDGKTALRGGYGITYNRVPTGTDCSYFCGINYPLVSSLTIAPASFPSPLGGKVAPPSAPTLDSQDLNLHPAAMVQSYSLSLERQFGANWYTSMAFAANTSNHVGEYYNINQPMPDPPYDYNPIINTGVFAYAYAPFQGYGSITSNVSPGVIRWDALEVSVKHPMAHDLFLSLAYTYQHGLSDQRGTTFFENSNTMQDIYNPRDNYGTTNLNVPQIFTASLIWNLPWYKNAHGFVGAALGGWQYSDITTIQSGFAQDPGLSVANQGLATRPDRVASNINGMKSFSEWFNTAAFAAPPAGYFGNAAPGSIVGPGTVNFDMAFAKDFHLGEHVVMNFRSEFFNIFNHTNFNGINNTFGSGSTGSPGSFGWVTSAADPRIVEFALRLQF
ncbi:MAG TPA: carboxypeptidase regulatory-like domain-containing protein [Terriglobia bacterium]